MNFLKNRPLSILLCLMLGGFSLFCLLPIFLKWIFFSITIIVGIIFFLFHKKIHIFPFVSSIVLLISYGLSVFYFNYYFPVYNRITEPFYTEAKISSVIYAEDFEVLVTVKTKRINDQPFSSSKLLVSFSPTDKTPLNLDINDTIYFRGEIEPFSESEYSFNEKKYYETKGIQGFVKNAEDVVVIQNSSFSILKFCNKARKGLNNYISRNTDENTSGLLSALITGDKSDLPDQMRLDFKRIGLSHILALSGMHLAILSTGLHKLLSLFKLDKKWRCAITLLFVIGYMGISGFPVSILRAGGMLILSNVLFLFAKTKDSFTNLMISAFLICTASPYSAHDTSLLLSILATIGVLIAITYLEKIPYHISRLKKLILAICASFLTSFFAISLTMPFSVFEFERLSYLSPVTTLIFSFIIEIFMYFGGLFLLFGAPSFLKPAVCAVSDFIADLAAYFSDIPNVYVSTNNLTTKILCIFFYGLLLSYILLKIKHKKLLFLCVSLLFCSIFVSSLISNKKSISEDRLVYYSDALENESILIYKNQKIAFVDLAKSNPVGNEFVLEKINRENIVSIDTFWIPQYTARLPKEINDILSIIPIHQIYLPEPQTEKEKAILESIKIALSKFRCGLEIISNQNSLKFEDTKLYNVYRSPMEDGFSIALSIKYNDEYYTYTSRGSILEKNTDLIQDVLAVSRGIIFGCNGRAPDNKFYLEFSSPHTDILIFETDDVEIDMQVYEEYKDRVQCLYMPKKVVLSD